MLGDTMLLTVGTGRQGRPTQSTTLVFRVDLDAKHYALVDQRRPELKQPTKCRSVGAHLPPLGLETIFSNPEVENLHLI